MARVKTGGHRAPLLSAGPDYQDTLVMINAPLFKALANMARNIGHFPSWVVPIIWPIFAGLPPLFPTPPRCAPLWRSAPHSLLWHTGAPHPSWWHAGDSRPAAACQRNSAPIVTTPFCSTLFYYCVKGKQLNLSNSLNTIHLVEPA